MDRALIERVHLWDIYKFIWPFQTLDKPAPKRTLKLVGIILYSLGLP